jgi:hypothetical protein
MLEELEVIWIWRAVSGRCGKDILLTDGYNLELLV